MRSLTGHIVDRRSRAGDEPFGPIGPASDLDPGAPCPVCAAALDEFLTLIDGDLPEVS